MEVVFEFFPRILCTSTPDVVYADKTTGRSVPTDWIIQSGIYVILPRVAADVSSTRVEQNAPRMQASDTRRRLAGS